MEDVSALTRAIDGAMVDLEPEPFRARVSSLAGSTSLTPGALTIRTARSLDPGVDLDAVATRAAGVQLSYEGLELTRSILKERRWEQDREAQSYYLDLLAAEVLVSRGFNFLSDTNVARDAVNITKKFGVTQTNMDQLGTRHEDEPLEVDILELSISAGTDHVLDTVPPHVRSLRTDIATKLLSYPLPEPVDALAEIDEDLQRMAIDVGAVHADD